MASGRARRPQTGVPRLRQLVVRFSDQELRAIRAAAEAAGLSVGAWVGQTVVSGAHAVAADAEFAERALLRALVEAQAAGCAAGDDAVGVLVAELIDVLVARLS